MEWEEQLPLQEYALRIRLGYVHRLPELLEKFEDLGRLEDAQKVGALSRLSSRPATGSRADGPGCECCQDTQGYLPDASAHPRSPLPPR